MRQFFRADKHILQKISHMMIEYHYGCKNLKEKIEKSYQTKNVFIGPRNLREGDIFAERY